MTQYESVGGGSFSRNEDKDLEDANPKWPDLKGRLKGVVCPHCQGKTDFWLNIWAKVDTETEGKPRRWFSVSLGSIKPKNEAPARQATPPPRGGGYQAELNDDIPF